jgi:hypothetical protein
MPAAGLVDGLHAIYEAGATADAGPAATAGDQESRAFLFCTLFCALAVGTQLNMCNSVSLLLTMLLDV